MPARMNDQDLVKLFEAVVHDVERLNELRRKDWKKAAQEVGLHRGLPCNYDDFCNDFFECGKPVARSLFEMAAAKLSENSKLRGRVKVETFLKPIEVEFAQRGIAKRAKIDKALVNAVFREAERRAASTFEDRVYFFPVYTIDVDNAEEYAFGPVTFFRARKFFKDNEAGLKASAEAAAKGSQKSDNPREAETHKAHISKLFSLAREHYGGYRWIAGIEIKGAEPDIGWKKAREVLEQTLGLLRLAAHSREGSFIGLIDENTTLRSASYMSLKTTKEFDVWHSSSYGEPHVLPGFLQDYRNKVPQLGNVEAIIEKSRQWREADAIEDRMLTALFWFNEAWKETRLLPKIVEFSTCIEGLFSTTGDHEAIAEKISERLAWLSFPGDGDWRERRNTYRTMKKVYGARSKAVHGDSAVKDLDLPALAHEAETQAELGMFAFMQLPPLFQDKKDKEKLLNEFFVRLKLEGLARARQVFTEDSAISSGLH
jgi:hypothetical protein